MIIKKTKFFLASISLLNMFSIKSAFAQNNYLNCDDISIENCNLSHSEKEIAIHVIEDFKKLSIQNKRIYFRTLLLRKNPMDRDMGDAAISELNTSELTILDGINSRIDNIQREEDLNTLFSNFLIRGGLFNLSSTDPTFACNL